MASDRLRGLLSSFVWLDVLLLAVGFPLAYFTWRTSKTIAFQPDEPIEQDRAPLARERPLLIAVAAAAPLALHLVRTARAVLTQSSSEATLNPRRTSKRRTGTIDRLFLFGAGASYGAVNVDPSPPPLAKSLYRDLLVTTNMWPSMPKVFEAGFQGNFEDGMIQLWNLAVADPSRSGYVSLFLHDLARYFSRYRPLPHNSYSKLIAQLERAGKFGGTVFATLNYECLLEQSLAPRLVEYFDYAASGTTSAVCWKLHGSCTFVGKQELIIDGLQFPIAQKMLGDDPLQVIPASEVVAYCDRQTDRPSAFPSPLVPRMAIFAQGKPFPFQPAQLATLADHWRRAVTEAKTIAVIGVNPNVSDSHIWAPIAATSAEIVAVGGSGDRDTWNRWANTYRPWGRYRYLGDGFEQNIEDIVAYL